MNTVDSKGDQIYMRMRDSARYAKIQDSYRNFRENLVVYHRNKLFKNQSRVSTDSKVKTSSPQVEKSNHQEPS